MLTMKAKRLDCVTSLVFWRITPWYKCRLDVDVDLMKTHTYSPNEGALSIYMLYQLMRPWAVGS